MKYRCVACHTEQSNGAGCMFCGGRITSIEETKLVPIGIMPEVIWKNQRAIALSEAINRYLGEHLPVPNEWLEEYNRLMKEISEVIPK